MSNAAIDKTLPDMWCELITSMGMVNLDHLSLQACGKGSGRFDLSVMAGFSRASPLPKTGRTNFDKRSDFAK